MIGLALSAFAGRVWALLKGINPLLLVIAALCASTALLWANASAWKGKAQACDAGRRADRAAYVQAQEEATLIATEAKNRIEARDTRIQKEQADVIAKARDDNRALADQWVRDQAARRATSAAYLPLPTDAPGKPDAPATEAVVPVTDIERCADAFTVAEGWQSWWATIAASHVEGRTP